MFCQYYSSIDLLLPEEKKHKMYVNSSQHNVWLTFFRFVFGQSIFLVDE